MLSTRPCGKSACHSLKRQLGQFIELAGLFDRTGQIRFAMIRNSSAPAQWRGGLAPGHERRDGELVVGGVPAGELAAQYGTPLLAVDYDVLDAAVARFLEACAPHGIEVAYA